jgi:hypothetical protein
VIDKLLSYMSQLVVLEQLKYCHFCSGCLCFLVVSFIKFFPSFVFVPLSWVLNVLLRGGTLQFPAFL